MTRDLRRAIITGEIAPGQVLLESALARRLGTSKTPVREALGLLRAQRFVEVIPHRGYFVSPISLRDVQDIIEARLHLEGVIAGLAAGRITSEELRRLEAIARADLVQPNTTAAERFAWTEQNKAFHMTIARAARNAELVQMMDLLLDKAARVVFLYYSTASLESHRRDHLALVEVLRRGNAEECARMMRRHIEQTGAGVLSGLRAAAPGGASAAPHLRRYGASNRRAPR